MRALVLYSARAVRTIARSTQRRCSSGIHIPAALTRTRLQLLSSQVVVENQLSTTTRWESQGRLPWAAARSP